MTIIRFFHIIIILHRYGLYDIFKKHHKTSTLALIIELMLFFIPKKQQQLPLPKRLYLAIEELGPIFVKFGQVLSTREDLITHEFAIELANLQSRVKPFSGKLAIQIVEDELECNLNQVFSELSKEPVASASVAQVHRGILLKDNQEVAIKILRPNIQKQIKQDVKLLMTFAWLIEHLSADGKRLRLTEVVGEFKKSLANELDLLQEAGNATELKRLHKNDYKILIPEVYYDYCTSKVMVMEWMNGTPISDMETLKAKHIDLVRLSHNGVDIFYTQVFTYGFFHADMHPGNILCDDYGRYIGLDFGIVGSLSENDKRYLAINILAFFNRDYKKVALTHIESGWAPSDTSVEELENAIRAVCEPIFNKPLSQISFGQVLVKLFQVSRQFNIAVQPQLVLLQKTIINVEGLGRKLNPELDLWVSAKPILEKWMKEQMGFKGFIRNLKAELPNLTYLLPKLPKEIANNILRCKDNESNQDKYLKLLNSYRRQNYVLLALVLVLVITIILKY